MPSFDIAHVREQGIDLIIVPLRRDFGLQPEDEQEAAMIELQARAESAGLAGTVVPVWDNGGGRMAFRAPSNYHPFFKSISLGWVRARLNRKLYW